MYSIPLLLFNKPVSIFSKKQGSFQSCNSKSNVKTFKVESKKIIPSANTDLSHVKSFDVARTLGAFGCPKNKNMRYDTIQEFQSIQSSATTEPALKTRKVPYKNTFFVDASKMNVTNKETNLKERTILEANTDLDIPHIENDYNIEIYFIDNHKEKHNLELGIPNLNALPFCRSSKVDSNFVPNLATNFRTYTNRVPHYKRRITNCTSTVLKQNINCMSRQYSRLNIDPFGSSLDYHLTDLYKQKTEQVNSITNKYLCLPKTSSTAPKKIKYSFYETKDVFLCEVCGKTFKLKQVLANHILQHINARSFACYVCEKSFNTKNYLHCHIRHCHTSFCRFSCQVCNKSFKSRQNLNSHLRIHQDMRPFTCDLCYKRFKRKSGLKEHMIVHSTLRPFICQICNKDFRRKSDLKRHGASH